MDFGVLGKLKTPLMLTAVAVAVLGFASGASAARDPIAGGTTDLHMKKGFLRKIANVGITVQPVGGGIVSGNKISVPVVTGKLDPTNVEGWLETGNGFKLARGARGVPITRLTVNTVRGAVYARIAKAHMQLGSFVAPVSAREGFGANLKAVKLALTAKAVQRISNRLGLRGPQRLNPERVLSNLYSTAQPETVTLLSQGNASLKVDPAMLKKLAEKGVKVPQGITPIAPATSAASVSFELPIAGGNLAPDASQGSIVSAGGIQVRKDAQPFSPTLRLTNVAVDFGAKTASAELELLPKPQFPGAAGRNTLVDVALPANSVSADPVARTITIKGAEARLEATAASTFNNVFNQPAPEPPPSSNFVVGDPLGTLTMTVQAR